MRQWGKDNRERQRAANARVRNKNAAPRVYVISNPAWSGIVKIGITSRNPSSRIAQLQTGDPFRAFKYEALIEVSDPKIAEAVLHAALDPHRIGGEWFRVSVEKAVALANTLAVPQPSR